MKRTASNQVDLFSAAQVVIDVEETDDQRAERIIVLKSKAFVLECEAAEVKGERRERILRKVHDLDIQTMALAKGVR